MTETVYISPKVCPLCGHRVHVSQTKMYPSGKMGECFFCPQHGILFEWELIAEASWPKQEEFLASKAGKVDYLLPGDR